MVQAGVGSVAAAIALWLYFVLASAAIPADGLVLSGCGLPCLL